MQSQQQQGDSGLQRLALLQQLGLMSDPMQELSGLVNLLNGLAQPDQFAQELALRQQGQDQQQQQFEQNFGLQQISLGQRTAQDQAQIDQWTQEFGLRKLLAQQEKELQLQQMLDAKAANEDHIAASIFGAIPQYAASGLNLNLAGLESRLSRGGLSGLFSSAGSSTGMPQGLNADQQQLWQARQKRYPQQ